MILRNNAFYFKIIKAPSLLQNYRSKGNEIHNLGRDSFSSQRVCLFTPKKPQGTPISPHDSVFPRYPKDPLRNPNDIRKNPKEPLL